jgi:hypothetical protein
MLPHQPGNKISIHQKAKTKQTAVQCTLKMCKNMEQQLADRPTDN